MLQKIKKATLGKEKKPGEILPKFPKNALLVFSISNNFDKRTRIRIFQWKGFLEIETKRN